MSLSDYIKHLRAIKGGTTPWEIADATGVSASDIHLIEVKHRRVGENDDMLRKLADYFGVPAEELFRRRDTYRKRLTSFLEENTQKGAPVVLKLEAGEELQGRVIWHSREAVAIAPAEDASDTQPFVVQRRWVADWRRAGSQAWEISA